MLQASLKTRMLEAFRLRMYFVFGLTALIFTILFLQLVNLQIIQGKEYQEKSRMNMENNIPIPAARGEMYDRNFVLGKRNVTIISNRPSFNITTIPANFKDEAEFTKTISLLSRLIKIPFEQIKKDVKERNRWERVILKEDVSFDTIIKIASHQDKFPHIDWEDASVRVYSHGNMFAHVVGYIGVISKEEYQKLKNKGYRHYQKIGKAGIEKEYDHLLRGVDGYIRRIVDVRKRTEGEEIGLEPVAGNNFILTIDYEVQKAAYEAMEKKKGTAIVIKARTGEVLAMVSKPDFDPNEIISKDNTDAITELMEDNEKPFINRAIQSRYPPASTFKLVTAIAALEEEKWDPLKNIYCSGKFTLKGFIDKDFYDYKVHGNLNLYWAIARSCSVYFYNLGHKIGPTVILKYADYLGLGEKTGLDIPGEISGFIPSKKWKLRTFGQSWYDGDTVNLSIGQGFMLVTPIGLTNIACALVNDGVIYKPQLIKEILTPDNRKVIRKFSPVKQRELPLSPNTINIIKEGMRLSVKGGGTSSQLNRLKIPIVGKTGTAQTRSKRKEDFSQHGWYIGYAPFEGPAEQAVVVLVFVEYGLGGAVGAVPVAEKIYSKMISLGYFNAGQK